MYKEFLLPIEQIYFVRGRYSAYDHMVKSVPNVAKTNCIKFTAHDIIHMIFGDLERKRCNSHFYKNTRMYKNVCFWTDTCVHPKDSAGFGNSVNRTTIVCNVAEFKSKKQAMSKMHQKRISIQVGLKKQKVMFQI